MLERDWPFGRANHWVNLLFAFRSIIFLPWPFQRGTFVRAHKRISSRPMKSNRRWTARILLNGSCCFFWFVFGFCFDVGCSKCVVAFYFTLFAAIFFHSIWIVCQKHCRYICWMIRRTLLFDEKCVAFGALFSPDGQGYLFNERIFSSYDWLFGHN